MIIRTAFAGAALTVAVLAPLRPAAAQPHSGDGFLFGAPSATVTLRGGLARPNEGSDLFSFVRHELSVNRGDFSGSAYGADVAFFVRPQWAVQFGLSTSTRAVPSSYRDWTDNAKNEIEQRSELRRTPLSAGLRYYFTPPGRAIGRLAWVPARFTTYAAGGVGVTWFNFHQVGDFVDYKTLDVFPADLTSSGHTASEFVALGAEYRLTTGLSLSGETRYDHARAKLGSSFSGFDKIDLSGLAFTMGLTVRF